MPPPLGSGAAIIMRLSLAKLMAAAHMVQGSNVTYRSRPGMRCVPAFSQASRMARISAWAVGSFSSRVRLPARAMMAPF